MNTAIADAFDLSWKLAWIQRGIALPSLLDTYEAERGPIGRRNVAMSMVPGGGGSDDGLSEDLGWVVGSQDMAFPPDGRPGTRAPHAWVRVDGRRRSTLDLFGRGLVLLTAGSGEVWQSAARSVSETSSELPLLVRSFGQRIDRDRSFATAYGLEPGGASLVRPDGVIAWRAPSMPADPASALARAIATTLGRQPVAGSNNHQETIGKEAA